MGKDLYQHQRTSVYGSMYLTDMGNGMYDFESAELTNADITRQMVMNDTVLRIVKEKLGNCGMNAIVGALPTKNTQGAHGRWHRD